MTIQVDYNETAWGLTEYGFEVEEDIEKFAGILICLLLRYELDWWFAIFPKHVIDHEVYQKIIKSEIDMSRGAHAKGYAEEAFWDIARHCHLIPDMDEETTADAVEDSGNDDDKS